MIFSEFVCAQVVTDSAKTSLTDSIYLVDTIVVKYDTLAEIELATTVSRRPGSRSGWQINSNLPLSTQLLQKHPYFNWADKPGLAGPGMKEFKGKELIFYVLITLLLLFALLKQGFPKYFSNLFRLFFQTTAKQRQIREQLIQTPLPSLLFNIFFVISAGLYIDILFFHFDLAPVDNFWLLFLYCAVGLSIIYMLKYLGLQVIGWLFNLKEAAEAYMFVVLIVNKMIGIFLVPFLVLLSFMVGTPYTIALVLSWCGIGILLAYRILLTHSAVRKLVRFNPFHFFLYLCAFEIAPLLLIYKALLFFFR